MNLLFIKQGVTSYGHIELAIERAASSLPDCRLHTVELPGIYFSQPSPLRQKQKPVRMNRAIHELLQRVRQDDSEVVLLLNGFVLHFYCPEFFTELKVAGRTLVTWQIDDPYYIDKTLPFVADLDVVFTVDSSTIQLYRDAGKRTDFLPLACDPELHRDYGPQTEPYQCDVCFIGVPFKGSRRIRLIDELAADLPAYHTKIIGVTEIDTWRKNLKRYAELKACIHDERIEVNDAVRYFAGARINLNIHKDSFGHAWDKNDRHIEARSPCERTFAIAGCGGFQLIDDTRADLPDFFEPGRELITFSDARDLKAKIDYYLKHDDERRAIAAAGQANAYARHTYRHRLDAMVEMLQGPG